MKSSILNIIMAGVAVCALNASSARAAEQIYNNRYVAQPAGSSADAKAELDDRTHAVNQAAKHGNMPAALKVISVETGVPLDQVQTMHKKYSDAGPAAILNACVMADETKIPPEEFLKKNQNGKSWTSIARQNNVSLEKFNDRLDHLQRALENSR